MQLIHKKNRWCLHKLLSRDIILFMDEIFGEKNKKTVIIAFAAIIVIIAIIVFYSQKEAELSPQELLIQKQKQELDILRGKEEALSREVMEAQRSKLDELRGDSESQTDEEINKQKEELNNLRQQ